MVNGWAWHPHHELSDVRLLSGNHLLAKANIDIRRQDVEKKVGKEGAYAFSLKLPLHSSSTDLSEEFQLIALTADGTNRFPLFYMKDERSTQSLLKAAFDPTLLGLQGNFDGLSSNQMAVSGWCFQSLNANEICTVYVQVEGIDPTPVKCDQRRIDCSQLGYPECCGFAFSLYELISLGHCGGKRLTVTYDKDGKFPLPEASQCFIPTRLPSEGLLQAPALGGITTEGQHNETLYVHAAHPFSGQRDFARHWKELDDFRKVCEIFEQEIAARIQRETLAKKKMQGSWRRLFGKRP